MAAIHLASLRILTLTLRVWKANTIPTICNNEAYYRVKDY